MTTPSCASPHFRQQPAPWHADLPPADHAAAAPVDAVGDPGGFDLMAALAQLPAIIAMHPAPTSRAERPMPRMGRQLSACRDAELPLTVGNETTTDKLDKRFLHHCGRMANARTASWRRVALRLKVPPGCLIQALPA